MAGGLLFARDFKSVSEQRRFQADTHQQPISDGHATLMQENTTTWRNTMAKGP